MALSVCRIAVLRDYLVGDGRAANDRWDRNEEGYMLPDARQYGRLRDAIERKNQHEIKAVLVLLREQEIKEGFTRRSRETGQNKPS